MCKTCNQVKELLKKYDEHCDEQVFNEPTEEVLIEEDFSLITQIRNLVGMLDEDAKKRLSKELAKEWSA